MSGSRTNWASGVPWLFLMGVVLLLLPRLGPGEVGAVTWILFFSVPTAMVLTTLPGEAIERRYLYFPALAVSALAASLIVKLEIRRALANSVLALILGWTLIWNTVGWWKMDRDSHAPTQQATEEVFRDAMSKLE